MDAKEFGKYMENLRLQAGYMSRRSLAQASGVWSTTIAKIEDATTKTPSIDTLKKLAPFLNKPYEEILMAAGFLEDDGILQIEMTDGRTYTELRQALKDLNEEELKAVLQFIKFTKSQRDGNK